MAQREKFHVVHAEKSVSEAINTSFYVMVKIVSPFGCTSNDLRSNANLMLRSHIWSLPSNNKRKREVTIRGKLHYFSMSRCWRTEGMQTEERACIKRGFAVHSRNSRRPRYTPHLMAREISGNDVCVSRDEKECAIILMRFFMWRVLLNS